MKLSMIREGYTLAKLREALMSTLYFQRPALVIDQPYEPTSGHDAGSQSTGGTLYPTGIPTNPRHRTYFGMEQRPGTIRL